MNELITLVSQRTGLPADKAQMAVDTVLGFLKDKLPAPIAGQIDGLVRGGTVGSASAGLADGMKNLGGMFGK